MSDTFILPTLEQAAKAEIENKPKTTTGKRGSIFFERERGQGNEAFKEFTTGFGEGITDLKTTGENIGRMIQGKELIPQRGNVFDNVVFSPLDAGIKSYQDGSDFGQNIAKSVDQSSKDFWKNPAREIGRALPAALTFAASFVAPPLAGAKIATTTGKAVSRASQAIGKAKPAAKLGAKGAAKATGKAKSGFTIKAVETTRKQGIGGLSKNVVSGRPGSKTTGKPGGIKKDTSIESGKWYAPQGKTNRPLARGKYAIGDKTNPNKFTTRPRSKARSDKSKGYKKSDPGKLVRKDNILADDIPKGVKIPDKPSELYSKEFVKTVNKAGKLQAKTKQGKLGNRITRETMSPRQTFKPSAMIYQTIGIDYFVGEEPLQAELDRLDVLLDSLDKKLAELDEEYVAIIESRGMTVEDYESGRASINSSNFERTITPVVDEYNRTVDEYNSIIDEYDTIVDALNCFYPSQT